MITTSIHDPTDAWEKEITFIGTKIQRLEDAIVSLRDQQAKIQTRIDNL